MPSLFPKQCLFLLPLVAVPLAIFFAAHAAASWRPQFIEVQPDVHYSVRAPEDLRLSPDGKTLTLWSSNNYGYQQDLRTGAWRKFEGGFGAVSKNGRTFLTFKRYELLKLTRLFLYSSAKQQWKYDLHTLADEGHSLFRFTDSGHQLTVSSDRRIRIFDVDSGKLVAQLPNNYDNFYRGYQEPELLSQTSTKSDDGRNLMLLYSDRRRTYGVEDVSNFKSLWAVPLPPNPIRPPRFENGGLSLAIIDGNSLVVHNSLTGALEHKYGLSTPIADWQFAKDQSVVYLLGKNGCIFRQKLR